MQPLPAQSPSDNLHAEFVISSPSLESCPAPSLPEFAFIGRSNVGKSSLINMICGNKNLAHTSGKPGKTSLINFFKVNHTWHLIDLPGYGYAKKSKVERHEFGKLISSYLKGRESLTCLFVLIDIRLPAQDIDLDFLQWVGEHEIPMAIAFTKADKLTQREAHQQVKNFEARFLENWEELPQFFITSAEKRTGRKEMISFINECVADLKKK